MRHGKVRGAAEALDRGAHHRLAEPLPPPEQGLGVPQPQRTGIPLLGIDPANATKALLTPTTILNGF